MRQFLENLFKNKIPSCLKTFLYLCSFLLCIESMAQVAIKPNNPVVKNPQVISTTSQSTIVIKQAPKSRTINDRASGSGTWTPDTDIASSENPSNELPKLLIELRLEVLQYALNRDSSKETSHLTRLVATLNSQLSMYTLENTIEVNYSLEDSNKTFQAGSIIKKGSSQNEISIQPFDPNEVSTLVASFFLEETADIEKLTRSANGILKELTPQSN